MIPDDVAASLDRLRRMVVDGAAVDGLASALASPAHGDDRRVAEAIYASWYLGLDAAADGPDPSSDTLAARPLVPLLRAAHAGSTRFERGWVVLATGHGGRCQASRDGLERVVAPGQYANVARPGAPVHPGDQVAVSGRVDVVDPTTGYWVTRSPPGEPGGAHGRLYLDVTAATVARAVRLLTEHLSAAGVLWSLKCPTTPEGYRRVEPLVCYVELTSAPVARAAGALVAAAGLVEPATPPLTERLASGVAWAEDPGNGRSFGFDRCVALARGVRCLATGDGGDAIDVLVRALADAGIDPSAPWRCRRTVGAA